MRNSVAVGSFFLTNTMNEIALRRGYGQVLRRYQNAQSVEARPSVIKL
jgi:hypothetical protein